MQSPDNGAWSDLALLPNGASALPNIDYGARKAWIVGDGNQKISFTKIEDIARFVAHSLTLFPAERLHNQTFRLEGDRKTWNEYFDLVERKAGVKYEVTRKDAEEVRKRIEGHEMEPKNLLEFIAWSWGTGGGLVGEPLANYEGWNPKKLEDLLHV
jgi:nucleoside-diphosphate-sugar epimerase